MIHDSEEFTVHRALTKIFALISFKECVMSSKLKDK
jgi:hypothetical protein